MGVGFNDLTLMMRVKTSAGLTTLPYGSSKEWLEANGDKTRLYQINGYVWGYIESNGWTQSSTQFLVVTSESEMTNEGGTEYLLRSGNEGVVYAYTEASGDTDVPVCDALPETAGEGDIVAVGGRKYQASLSSTQEPDYINLADPSSSDWATDSKINSSANVAANTGTIVTNFIGPLVQGDVVRVQGMNLTTNNSPPFKSDKTMSPAGSAKLTAFTVYDCAQDITATETGGQFTVGSYAQIQNGYWRFSGAPTDDANHIIITINQEIKNKTVTKVTWTDLGEYTPPVHAGWRATDETYAVIDSLSDTANNGDAAVYSADGYLYTYISGAAWVQTSKYNAPTLTVDGALSTSSANAVQNKVVASSINEVKATAKTQAEQILTLQNEVEALGGGAASETATIPSYWETEVAEKTEVIKALQTKGGKACVCFAWASDTHIPDNDNGRTTDIGKVMAKMLDNCEIPFAVLTGDINTRASYDTEAGLLTAQARMPDHLYPLWGTDRLLMALGNHDGTWGDSTGYYRHQFTPERMWQVFFRGQALDFRRVFSDDGLYYYVDNLAQKTRFIVLNSHFGGEYEEDVNGWAVNNRFSTSCYGQAQLNWLADVALDMPEGYGAILYAHVPPYLDYNADRAQLIGIVNAYCNKTTFSGSYTAGVDGWSNSTVSVDFTGAKGEIIAMFAGHVHVDKLKTDTMACPLLTIISAGASVNDYNLEEGEVAPTRTHGTATETSFDVVTVNRTTRTITCTRVGAGEDREVSY